MTEIRYRDTRGLDPKLHRFTDAVVKGIAEGGGLYVPEELPRLRLEDILTRSAEPYPARVQWMYECFGVDIHPARMHLLAAQAYGDNFDHPAVAPVAEVTPGTHVLELWHGPTSAFKDMALQLMPLTFAEAVRMKREAGETGDDHLILVATSGDTGKAALEGFRDREHVRIVVFYPAEGVSDIQRLQMVTQEGRNVGVFGVDGNFDDCQTAVKAAFSDGDFNAWLHREHRLELSSANSINWGRLLPQIVYYVSAYADVVSAGGVKPGDTVDVCVPTGNFGNILAAYYAKRMGVPIGRMMCASNENNVLTDFIDSGTYDISERSFVTTPSPSMDILISSNLERLLFEVSGDPDDVRGWMTSLNLAKQFRVDKGTFAQIRDQFSADYVTNDESLKVIKRVWDEHGYLLDPHTAIAWEVAERLRGECPVLVVATAHWAKFGVDVYKALAEVPYDYPLPANVADLSELELLAKVRELAPASPCVPRALAGLDGKPERFARTVEGTRDGVERAIRGWLR